MEHHKRDKRNATKYSTAALGNLAPTLTCRFQEQQVILVQESPPLCIHETEAFPVPEVLKLIQHIKSLDCTLGLEKNIIPWSSRTMNCSK